MTTQEKQLHAALMHGTDSAVSDTNEGWMKLHGRLRSARRRSAWLRGTAAAAAALVAVTMATPTLRASAAELWQEVLRFTQGRHTYEVLTGGPVQPAIQIPQRPASEMPSVLDPKTVALSPENAITITTNGQPTGDLPGLRVEPASVMLNAKRFSAEAGQFPAEAMAAGLVPFRRPALMPEAKVDVTVSSNAPAESLQGWQRVEMGWIIPGEGVIRLVQTQALSRADASAPWQASDGARKTTLVTIPGKTSVTERDLAEGVKALRHDDGQQVEYLFSLGGVDYSLTGPAAREELLLQMAQSLVK